MFKGTRLQIGAEIHDHQLMAHNNIDNTTYFLKIHTYVGIDNCNLVTVYYC